MYIEALQYPIGKFTYHPEIPDLISTDLQRIASLPSRLREAVSGFSEEKLDTPYRDGGWTLRQVVHHLPDSHSNAYIRFKLAATEINPTIRPYDEVAWAECRDARSGDIALSLNLLEALHARWHDFLTGLTSLELERTYFHPASQNTVPLAEAISMYAWHGDHHLAHITSTRERHGW